jgi:predicted nucleotidyltransferase
MVKSGLCNHEINFKEFGVFAISLRVVKSQKREVEVEVANPSFHSRVNFVKQALNNQSRETLKKEVKRNCNMGIDERLNAKRDEILRIAAKYGARKVRIFGSVARGEAGPDSDVDVLVDLEPGRSLFELGGLLMDLQDLLDCKVDVVTEKGLRNRIRDRVLQEAVPI